MPVKNDGLERRPIIDLSGSEAKSFFLKNESYSTVELPPYFRFDDLLGEVAKIMRGNSAFKERCRKAKKLENVNYRVLTNKDGRYAWRPCELIHPVLYVSLVKQMTMRDSWSKIVSRFREFALNPRICCLSIPVQSLTPREDKAEQIKQWWLKVEQESIELSLDFEYTFQTDIVDCYPSLYTHSIAWSLHTKSVAKAKRNKMSLIGNVIDLHIQAMRYGQTNGIPQGSVLMNFIAEMILGYADSKLSRRICKEKIEDYQILRYRDDYRIFVNNPQDGEKILKCLTGVMIELGLKLGPEKTWASSEVISSSIKKDKLDWLFRKTRNTVLHKKLLVIHDQNTKHPNSGSISRGLQDFDAYLEKRLERQGRVDFPLPMIGIVVDIALRSPRTYPISAAILSKLIDCLDSEEEKRCAVERVKRRFLEIPNTGHMDIWLQRLSLKPHPSITYEESLCSLVCKEPVAIWNNDWIDMPKLRSAIDPIKVIDEEELEKVKHPIPNEEVRLFDGPYPW